MFASTRRWLRRNRTPVAIGVGVIGAGYVATQYILSRLNDARERMSSDRIAKEKYAMPRLALHSAIPGLVVLTLGNDIASDDDLSKIKRTVHSQSLRYYPPRQRISWRN
jgi:hypothetical protein